MDSPYQLLIFDWDGTLADSTAQIVCGVQTAFAEHGLPPPEAEAVRHIIGLSLRDAVAQLLPGLNDTQTDQVIQAYQRHYFTRRTPTVLFADATAVLERLHAHFPLTVATGKGRRGLDTALAETDAARFFAATRTPDECAAKPNPDMVLSLCEEFGISPKQALVIGDTTHDLHMAANAGSSAVALTTGAHDAATLAAAPHLAVLDSLSRLPHFLGLP